MDQPGRLRYYLRMGVVDWNAELTRGVLSHAVLTALEPAPSHGYELVSTMREHGFPRLNGGTLYPLLRRLEEQGLVSHEWDTSAAGPAKKVFRLTELGVAELQHARTAWAEMGQALHSLQSTHRPRSEK